MRSPLGRHGFAVGLVILTTVGTIAAIYLFALPRWLELGLVSLAGISSVLVMEALRRERARLQKELERQAEALALAERRKEEFLATAAHELRNMLATMLFSVEGLRLLPPDSPAFHETRDVLGQKVRHMSRLLDDLLEVSRITRNKVQLHEGTVEARAGGQGSEGVVKLPRRP